MSPVYIFTTATQPATRFVDRNGLRPMWFRYSPQSLMVTTCCHRRRWAKHLRVQTYYDGLRVWCAKGRGCRA